MAKKLFSVLPILLMVLTLSMPFIAANDVLADKLSDAIAKAPQGNEKGQIDPEAAPGFLGIPGAPSINMIIGLVWAIWVGWIFSTVGAFGGIMAGVGHMTIYGLGAYAKTFKDTAPQLNKFVTDSIRVSNQWLVGLSALVSSVNYYRQKRLVPALGLFLGSGAIFATLLVVFTTAGKIKFSQYQGWFGLCVFVIGGFMIYEMSPKGQATKKAAAEAAKAFEGTIKGKGKIEDQGVKTLSWSLKKVEILFSARLSVSAPFGLSWAVYLSLPWHHSWVSAVDFFMRPF